MSGNEDEQRLWARRVLAWESATARLREIEVQAAVRDQLGHATEAQALRAAKQRLGGALGQALIGDDLEAGAATAEQLSREAATVIPTAVDASAAKGQHKALDSLMKTLEYEMAMTDATGRTEAALKARLASLDARFKQTTAATPKDQLDALEDSARDFLNDALKEGYSADKFRREMVPDQRNSAYAKMIKERYGVTVNFAYDKTVDLGRLYDALGLLPQEHVQTDSLTQIVMSAADGALGDYGRGRIRIDAVKVKARPKIEYKVEGSTKTLDTLSIVTVHEVGHAVDDKAKIMATPGDRSYGGWAEDVPVATVAAAYWSVLEPKVDGSFKNALLAEIAVALGGGSGSRPPGLSERDWRAASATLKACQDLAKDKEPWKKARPIEDVVYHFTYNKWYAYSKAARDAATVRDYQWRAPGEWFAELYAASWATKTKPPSAVNAKAAEYMFRGPA